MPWGRRRRQSTFQRYISADAKIPIASGPTDPLPLEQRTSVNTRAIELAQEVASVDKLLTSLDAHATRKLAILRTLKPFQWKSRQQVCQNLRFLLHERGEWLRARFQFTELANKIASLHVRLDHRTDTVSPYSLLNNNNTGNDTSIRNAAELDVLYPSLAECELVFKLFARFNALQVQLDLAYHQFHEFHRDNLPEWTVLRNATSKNKELIKKIRRKGQSILCRGSFDAYSLLMALATGRITSGKPDQHFLFGWCFEQSYHYDGTQIFQTLRVASKTLHARIAETKHLSIVEARPDLDEDTLDKNGKDTSPPKPHRTNPRPSVTQGYKIFASHRNTRPYEAPNPSTPRERYVDIARQNPPPLLGLKHFNALSYTGIASRATPYLVDYVRREVQRDEGKSLRIRNRIVKKIMQIPEGKYCNNNLTTLFLDTPLHVGGDDYIVQAMWANSTGRGYSSDDTAGMGRTYGWVYLRRGWNDMYHCAVEDASVKGIPHEESMRILNASVPLPDIVHAQLEASTEYFFRQKRAPEYNNITPKQRKARILRKLRALPALTRKDSHGVGNCVPGTEQFIQDLSRIARQPIGEVAQGRSLAILWRKSGYIQENRFAAVVDKLHTALELDRKKQEAIQAELDRRIQEAMMTDYDAITPQNFPLESIALPYQPERVVEERLQDDGSYVTAMQAVENQLNAEIAAEQAMEIHPVQVASNEHGQVESVSEDHTHVSPALIAAMNGDPSGAMTVEEAIAQIEHPQDEIRLLEAINEASLRIAHEMEHSY